METTLRGCTDVFGLYELANDGTILYSRARNGSELQNAAPERIGQDFFSDVAPFQNVGDLRRHFRRFITSDRPVDSFLFDCLHGTEIVRAKILMTRGYENDHDHAGGIVIMDIRIDGQ